MKLGVRFFISWIFSAVVMFSLFYTWHGIFLNDFKRIHFPLGWFVAFAACTYLLVSAGIYFLFESFLLRRIRNMVVRGLVAGASVGASIFMIATIVNISFTRHLSLEHLAVDGVWQISEQLVGAIVIVICKGLIHEHQVEPA